MDVQTLASEPLWSAGTSPNPDRSKAIENPTWGYTRIQGALKTVGHRVGRSTIARVLRAHGMLPGGQRATPWRTFVQAHWPALVAADFFTTEVRTPEDLRTNWSTVWQFDGAVLCVVASESAEF